MSQIMFMRTPCSIALKLTPQNIFGDNSTLVQLDVFQSSGNKPISEWMLTQIDRPYGITKLQWDKTMRLRQDDIFKCIFLNENVLIFN